MITTEHRPSLVPSPLLAFSGECAPLAAAAPVPARRRPAAIAARIPAVGAYGVAWLQVSAADVTGPVTGSIASDFAAMHDQTDNKFPTRWGPPPPGRPSV